MIERRFKWKKVTVKSLSPCETRADERSGVLLQFVTIDVGTEAHQLGVGGVMLLDDGNLEVVPHQELRLVSGPILDPAKEPEQ